MPGPASPHASSRLSAAALFMAVVQLAMLGALYTETPPHPPLTVAPFAIAPMLSSSIGLSLALAWLAARGDLAAARWLSLPVVILALVSYGPQKYFDPAFPHIWIAVIPMQIALLSVAILAVAPMRDRKTWTAPHTA